jgi:PAS domain S-box-containing protein
MAHSGSAASFYPAAALDAIGSPAQGSSRDSVAETLDRISRSGEAVIAMDGKNRIVHWNRAAESLLGLPARAVMGKPCYEVLGGRDAYGNEYCHQNCPVAHQARDAAEIPVHPFALSVRTGDGSRKTITSSLFSIPSYHPAVDTLVHVFRETESSPPSEREPLTPVTTEQGKTSTLTAREKEILSCLAEGLPTEAIARKLFISVVTVRNHVQNILRKLDVHTKLAAVVFARRHALV